MFYFSYKYFGTSLCFYFEKNSFNLFRVIYSSAQNETMGCPSLVQPGLNNSLENQINIAHSLYNVILATVQNREELERFWLAISQDLDLVDAQEQLRIHRNERNHQ